MQKLTSPFRSDGCDFLILDRRGTTCLLSKTKPDWDRPSYEVVKLQVRKAENRFGKEYSERELMPASEAWGQSGWTYCDIDSAKSKFDKLIAHRKAVI